MKRHVTASRPAFAATMTLTILTAAFVNPTGPPGQAAAENTLTRL